MVFRKGQSGNPGGRPKVVSEVRELAQKNCTKAIKRLVWLMENAADERVQKAAADSILDRGIGKPAQVVDMNINRDSDFDASSMTDDELDSIIMGDEPKHATEH